MDVDLPVLEKDQKLQQIDHVPEVLQPIGKEDIAAELDSREDGHWPVNRVFQRHKCR